MIYDMLYYCGRPPTWVRHNCFNAPGLDAVLPGDVTNRLSFNGQSHQHVVTTDGSNYMRIIAACAYLHWPTSVFPGSPRLVHTQPLPLPPREEGAGRGHRAHHHPGVKLVQEQKAAGQGGRGFRVRIHIIYFVLLFLLLGQWWSVTWNRNNLRIIVITAVTQDLTLFGYLFAVDFFSF